MPLPRKLRPAARSGWMGNETQIQPRDSPQKPEPEEESEVPAQQDELKDRHTDEGIPIPGSCEMQPPRIRGRIPARRAEGDLAAPDPEAQRVDQRHECDFRDHRVAHTQGGGNGLVKSRHVFGDDDAPLDELRHHGADAKMDDQLGRDQDGQRDQEPNVYLDVVEERNRDGASQRMACERRQQQERHPCDTRDDQHPPTHQLQRISGQLRSPEQLIQRTTEHQGEVRLFVQHRRLGHGTAWRTAFSSAHSSMLRASQSRLGHSNACARGSVPESIRSCSC